MDRLRQWGDVLASDLRSSVRALVAAPGFALTVVSTLAIGLAATTAVFSVVHAVLLSPLPYPEPDRLVSIARTARGLRGPASIQKFAWWRDHAGAFDHL